MKVLVTGANGQLGRSLRRSFAGAQDDNSGAQDDSHNDSSVILNEVKNLSVVYTDVEELDITDLAAIRKMVADEGINVIVNCAGYTNVDGAEDNPDLARLLNATAVENLAVAMKEVGGLLVHISTDYVYGGEALNTPIPETQKPAPQGVYAVTKLQGEEAIARVGCRHIIIRTAWLYSEYGKNFVKTMLRLTAEKPSLKVVFDQVGTPTYAGDLAEAIVKLLEIAGQAGNDGVGASNIFHYTDEGVCSWYDFAKAIAAYAGQSACDIQPCHSDEFPSKVHRPAYSVLDKSKIKSVLGITIPHWTDSLKVCLKALS